MIRRRLVVAVSLTVALAVGLGSVLIVSALEDRLIDDVDAQFTNGTFDLGRREQILDRGPQGSITVQTLDQRRRTAIVRYGHHGRVLGSLPSGTVESPDPLPDAGDLSPRDGIQTVSSIDDGPRYRALALPGRGATTVVAVSLDEVDETLREARRIQFAVGLAAIIAVAAVCWFLIRRSFAPIDGMISTAGRIAGGRLDERTDVDDPESEVGRLGAALNTMLDRIQEAVAEKTESEERMRRFVADASHDLRTPLTSVRGYAELYRKGATDPAAVATGMQRIEAEATRMSRLVDDLMLLARLDREPAPAAGEADIGRIAGDAVDAARVVDGDRTYDLDVAPDLGHITGDADQLRQVFDNLLGNAGQHTPVGATVSNCVLVHTV